MYSDCLYPFFPFFKSILAHSIVRDLRSLTFGEQLGFETYTSDGVLLNWQKRMNFILSDRLWSFFAISYKISSPLPLISDPALEPLESDSGLKRRLLMLDKKKPGNYIQKHALSLALDLCYMAIKGRNWFQKHSCNVVSPNWTKQC